MEHNKINKNYKRIIGLDVLGFVYGKISELMLKVQIVMKNFSLDEAIFEVELCTEWNRIV